MTYGGVFHNGFTLLEMLLAIVILAVVVALVYGAFSSTITSASRTRVALEELRLRQFLLKSLETNFSTVFVGRDIQEPTFRFIGVNGESLEGPRDSVRFCSTAPVIGGVALPGDVKEVQYVVEDVTSSEMDLSWGGENQSKITHAMLHVLETPLLGGNVQSIDGVSGSFVVDPNYESPSWTVPIRTLNVQYFDGSQWVDEWDSQSMGRLPWAVWIKINFARTQERLEYEKEKGFSVIDDPDFEMIIPIRAGLGRREEILRTTGTNSTSSGQLQGTR